MTQTAAEIKGTVAAIIGAYYANKNAKITAKPAVDPNDTEAPKRQIQGFKQETNDVSGDSTLTARDAGNLTKGKTRLNIISALSSTRDKVDFFKFTATADEKLGIAITTDKGVRTQILDARGRVVADSEAKFGDKYDNFQKAGAQNLDIKKGVYFIKVTRETGAAQDLKSNYAIQISSTKRFTQDYDTTEKPELKTTYYSSNTYSTAGIGQLLGQFNGGLFDSANGTYYNKKV